MALPSGPSGLIQVYWTSTEYTTVGISASTNAVEVLEQVRKQLIRRDVNAPNEACLCLPCSPPIPLPAWQPMLPLLEPPPKGCSRHPLVLLRYPPPISLPFHLELKSLTLSTLTHYTERVTKRITSNDPNQMPATMTLNILTNEDEEKEIHVSPLLSLAKQAVALLCPPGDNPSQYALFHCIPDEEGVIHYNQLEDDTALSSLPSSTRAPGSSISSKPFLLLRRRHVTLHFFDTQETHAFAALSVPPTAGTMDVLGRCVSAGIIPDARVLRLRLVYLPSQSRGSSIGSGSSLKSRGSSSENGNENSRREIYRTRRSGRAKGAESSFQPSPSWKALTQRHRFLSPDEVVADVKSVLDRKVRDGVIKNWRFVLEWMDRRVPVTVFNRIKGSRHVRAFYQSASAADIVHVMVTREHGMEDQSCRLLFDNGDGSEEIELNDSDLPVLMIEKADQEGRGLHCSVALVKSARPRILTEGSKPEMFKNAPQTSAQLKRDEMKRNTQLFEYKQTMKRGDNAGALSGLARQNTQAVLLGPDHPSNRINTNHSIERDLSGAPSHTSSKSNTPKSDVQDDEFMSYMQAKPTLCSSSPSNLRSASDQARQASSLSSSPSPSPRRSRQPLLTPSPSVLLLTPPPTPVDSNPVTGGVADGFPYFPLCSGVPYDNVYGLSPPRAKRTPQVREKRTVSVYVSPHSSPIVEVVTDHSTCSDVVRSVGRKLGIPRPFLHLEEVENGFRRNIAPKERLFDTLMQWGLNGVDTAVPRLFVRCCAKSSKHPVSTHRHPTKAACGIGSLSVRRANTIYSVAVTAKDMTIAEAIDQLIPSSDLRPFYHMFSRHGLPINDEVGIDKLPLNADYTLLSLRFLPKEGRKRKSSRFKIANSIREVAPSRSVSVSNLKEYRRQRSIRGKAFRAPFWMMGVCNDEEEDCIVEYGGREKNALAEGGSSGTDGEEEESVMPLRSRMLKAVSRMKMSPRQQITPRDRVEMSPIRADFSNESVSTEKTGDKINKDQPTDDVTTKTEKRKEKINKDRPSDDVTDDVTMKHESATRPEEKKKTRPSKKKKKKKSNTIRVKKTKVMDVTEPTPPSNNFYEQRSTAYKILLSPRGESSSTSDSPTLVVKSLPETVPNPLTADREPSVEGNTVKRRASSGAECLSSHQLLSSIPQPAAPQTDRTAIQRSASSGSSNQLLLHAKGPQETIMSSLHTANSVVLEKKQLFERIAEDRRREEERLRILARRSQYRSSRRNSGSSNSNSSIVACGASNSEVELETAFTTMMTIMDEGIATEEHRQTKEGEEGSGVVSKRPGESNPLNKQLSMTGTGAASVWNELMQVKDLLERDNDMK